MKRGQVTAPPAVVHNMTRGLELCARGKAGKGLRPETRRWAQRLVDGEELSYARAVEMRAWFARFRHNGPAARSRATRPEGPAMVSWLLRGGDPGEDWVCDVVDYLIPMDL